MKSCLGVGSPYMSCRGVSEYGENLSPPAALNAEKVMLVCGCLLLPTSSLLAAPMRPTVLGLTALPLLRTPPA